MPRTEPESVPNAAGSEARPLDLDEDPWRIEFNSWVWLMGVYGDMGVRGRTARVSASFSDILDGSDSLMALSGRLEIGYEKFAVFVDGLYSEVGVDNARAPDGTTTVDITFKQSIVDFGVMYRVAEWEPTPGADRNARNVTVDLYAGARYTGLELEIDPSGAASQSGDEDWFDPIVGAKWVVPFAEHWHLALNGDIGGFGVESDFTWSATAVVGYDFHIGTLPASLMFGYRAMSWDYTRGSGDSEFTWDLSQHGAILGFSLLF